MIPIADSGTKRFSVSKDDSGATKITPLQKTKAWMQVAVSFLMLLVALLVLTSPNFFFRQTFDESTKKWAAGWVGTVIGYWLS